VKTHLNTLFVTTENAYLRKDGAAVAVEVEDRVALRVPLHNLDGIVCFGWQTGMSPSLMGAATDAGLTISFLTPWGKFRARVVGRVSGNVLLRREQYRRADSEEGALATAREFVAAKVANARVAILRAAREIEAERAQSLRRAARMLKQTFRAARNASSLDSVRGVEGEGAARYFGVFGDLIGVRSFEFAGRVKHPAPDPVNCLLSFAYALLRHDLVSACESVGLDPAVGFLHRDRPGRPGLALDLMEELRPVLADRLVLTLLNRQQICESDFEIPESGTVRLREKARKRVLAAYQERKNTELQHPYLKQKMTWGLVPHIQARLLARYLRGDLDAYPAFYWR